MRSLECFECTKAACSPALNSFPRCVDDDLRRLNALDNTLLGLPVVHYANQFRSSPCDIHNHLGVHHSTGQERPAGRDNRMRRFSCIGMKVAPVKGENQWCQHGMSRSMDGSRQVWVANGKFLPGMHGTRATTHYRFGLADWQGYIPNLSWFDGSSERNLRSGHTPTCAADSRTDRSKFLWY